MSFLSYISTSLIAPSYAGFLISKGLSKAEEKKIINEIEKKILAFNRSFDDTEVDSNFFVEYIEQIDIVNSIFCRVFEAYKTSTDDYSTLSVILAKDAISFVNLRKDEFKHPRVKRVSDFENYFSELFKVLIAYRESLLSIENKAIASIVDESIKQSEMKIIESIAELKRFGVNIKTCEELNLWYISNTRKKCSLELFNHENNDFANDFLFQLSNNDIYIDGENIFEAVAYIAFLFLNDERFMEYRDKLLIVEDEITWTKLNKCGLTGYIFINRFRNEKHLELINSNKSIFIYGKNDSFKPETKIKLEQRFFRNLIEKIKDCGYEHQEAYEIAIASRNNYKLLMRRLLIGKLEEPSWAETTNYNLLLPALIINQWVDSDSDLFELLFDTESKYKDYLAELSKLNDSLDPFFVEHTTWHHTSKYMISDPDSAWDLFNEFIDESLFEKLEPMIDLIFSEIDPKFDLPTEQHYYANVLGYKPQFSEVMKNGFLETLVLLSRPSSNIANQIKNKVKSILGNIRTNKEWFAMSESLPMIIEIYPEAVLDKVEEDVKNFDSGLINLFHDKSDDLFSGRNYYTHIIWSLEKALYIESTMFRTIRILATLMDYDIDYKMSNSPMNTLYNALVAWHHDYIYTIEEKIGFVNYIVKNYSKGWELLEKLLPSNNSGTITGLSKPSYNSFLLSDDLKFKKQIYDTYNVYFRIAIDNIESDIEKLLSIYRNTLFINFGFYEEVRDITIALLDECSDEKKYKVYKTVFKLVSRHRHFEGSDWSHKEEDLQKLEDEILSTISFDDESYLYQHMFESYDDFILNPIPYNKDDGRDSLEGNNKLKENARRHAIEELLKLEIDWNAYILRLDDNANNTLGVLLAEYKYNLGFIVEMSKSLIESDKKNILAAYYGSLYRQFGIKIVEDFIKNEVLRKKKYIRLILRNIEICSDSVDFLNNLNDEFKEIYWKIEDRAYMVREEVKDFAIDNCILYENASTLIEIADRFDYSTEKLIKALEVTQKSGMRHHQMTAYHIDRILDKVYSDNFPNETYANRVMHLEIYFMNVIDEKRKLKYLIYNLSNDPKFVAELIRYSYKSESGDEKKELNEKEKRLAEVSHSILFSIKFSPTNHGVGPIIYDAIENWCKDFIQEVKKNDQKTIGYQYLGHFLANTNELNNEYPQESVKQVIEKYFNDDLLNGFAIEISNRVGIRSISTGRDYKLLSDKYRNYAEKSKMYPYTYKILNRISDNFFAEYEHEKASAKYEG